MDRRRLIRQARPQHVIGQEVVQEVIIVFTAIVMVEIAPWAQQINNMQRAIH